MGQILIAILGAVLFFAAGAGLGYWYAVGGRQRKRAQEIQEEFDAYRDRVSNHFAQTAEHFRTIGREYRALYDHMASGADALCDPQSVDGRLSFMPGPPADATNTAERSDGEGGAVADAADAEGASDDETTPDERARGLGGESAPAEDERDTQATSEADAEAPAPATDRPQKDAADAEKAEPEVAVDETVPADEDRERTLH